MKKKIGMGARWLLASIGGLAAMVAGAGGHYQADYATPKKKRNRARLGHGNYGASLIKHFDAVGVNWSAKKNKVAKSASRNMVALKRTA